MIRSKYKDIYLRESTSVLRSSFSLWSSSGFWLSYLFYLAAFWSSKPICCRGLCGPKTKSTIHEASTLLSECWGWGGCAIFLDIAFRDGLRQISRWMTISEVHTFPQVSWQGYLPGQSRVFSWETWTCCCRIRGVILSCRLLVFLVRMFFWPSWVFKNNGEYLKY